MQKNILLHLQLFGMSGEIPKRETGSEKINYSAQGILARFFNARSALLYFLGCREVTCFPFWYGLPSVTRGTYVGPRFGVNESDP
jgi:hypothetical protein